MLRRSCFIGCGVLRYPPLDPSLRRRSFYQRRTRRCHPLTDYSSAFFTHQGQPMWADIHADDQSVSGYFLRRLGQLQPMAPDGRGPGEGIGGPAEAQKQSGEGSSPMYPPRPRGPLERVVGGSPEGSHQAGSMAAATEAASHRKHGPIQPTARSIQAASTQKPPAGRNKSQAASTQKQKPISRPQGQPTTIPPSRLRRRSRRTSSTATDDRPTTSATHTP
jgi:hypothetical protein